ncbi:sugar ABC transporter permease [Paenibacillus thalictri]|uniref:Sugar ABC transporter permease n=2 Tax=Paenibacillus thalictri TaxID=2527873 RepID=A0A4Q9DEY8_9BACL|nr:sugar ABC transporter permease [Paenibacillus thalictri]
MTLPYMLIAFQKFNYSKGLFSSDWIGFKNFDFFFQSSRAGMVTWNTIKLNFLFVLFGTLMAIVMAILLNEARKMIFKRLAQSVFLFPHFLSWVIVSYMLYGMFSADYGIVNKIIAAFGGDPVNWYSSPGPWTWILVMMSVWKETGMTTVIYLAAISAMDESLYEAARMDGANRWQQIRSITIPLLIPTVSILTLLAIGKIFYADFGMIYAIIGDNGLLYPTTDVIDTFVFRTMRNIDPSQAMAVGLYQSVVGFVLVLAFNWIAKKINPENAVF